MFARGGAEGIVCPGHNFPSVRHRPRTPFLQHLGQSFSLSFLDWYNRFLVAAKATDVYFFNFILDDHPVVNDLLLEAHN